MIEAAGLRFVAPRVQLPLVTELRVDVRMHSGHCELVVSHPTWTPAGSC